MISRELAFKLLEQAEFKRTKTCCEDVPFKFCSNDEWRGSMDGLFYLIEKEAQTTRLLRELIEIIRNDFFWTCGADLTDLTDHGVKQLGQLDTKALEALELLKQIDSISN